MSIGQGSGGLAVAVVVAGQVGGGMVGGEVAVGLTFGLGDRGGCDVDDAAEGAVDVADDDQGRGEQGGDDDEGDGLAPVVLAGQADSEGCDGDDEGGEEEPEDDGGMLEVAWVRRSSRSSERLLSAATSMPKTGWPARPLKDWRTSVDQMLGAGEPLPSAIAGHSWARTARA
ncbi:hypothetical protein ACFC5A_29490 [Streptomyces yangpuensis]|uniref:hypothetical protein n=1 Tax=Streptomyces yangpuensis TaxID=1648182 RepID=UPI0035DEA686